MSNLTKLVNKKDHIKGNTNAAITLVEYGDFECPDCGEAYYIIKDIQKVEGETLKFVFRHFPLSESHPHAKNAAWAAEAAGLQGKFWEMHDMIFENQDTLEDEDLINFVKELNLDIEKFLKDFLSQDVKNKVEEDFLSGLKSGVNGTPTFYINGERHDDGYDYETLLVAIERGLAKQN